MFKNVSLQEESIVDSNDSDTEDEEETEGLRQKYSHSPENSRLIADNFAVCNPSNIGNGVDVGYQTKSMKLKEQTCIGLDIKISIWSIKPKSIRISIYV